MQASRVSGRAPVVATPVGAAPSAPASAATVAVAGPVAAPAPQAIVAPAIKEIAADAGRAEVVGAVAQAVWMPATTLWQAVKDGAGNAATQVLLSDVLVARAAELDPGMLTTILKQLPSALRSAAQPNDTAAITVAENLVEALLALMPRLSAAQLKTGQGQLQRLRLVDVPAGVVARLDALKTAWSTAMAEPTAFNIATKPLRTDAVLPLEAAEAQALRSVVSVDLEPVVNAKIPADLPLVSVPFARDYYSKGWLGRPEPGVLVTDTGNALVPGIIDHHQLGERTCAAALVLNRAELLVEQHLSAPVTKLICHTSPDLDAVSSVFLPN